MAFIVIGILLLLIAFVLKRSAEPQVIKLRPLLKLAGALILLAGIFSASIRQIEPGEVGVQTLFGQVQNRTLESGLNLVNPMVEVVSFPIKTQNYTMSGVHDEGVKGGDDAIRVLTADGLEVIIDLTVLFRVLPNEAPRILQEIGKDYLNTVVRPVTRTRIRDNAVYYDAISLYSTKRDEFQARIFKTIELDFKKRGLFLEQLLVRNITLPQSVKATIESKINAEQEAQKMQFVLQKEKQEAERKRVEAHGIADYQKIISMNLTDKQLQYETIKANQAIATSPNAKVIIMSPNNKTPLIISDK